MFRPLRLQVVSRSYCRSALCAAVLRGFEIGHHPKRGKGDDRKHDRSIVGAEADGDTDRSHRPDAGSCHRLPCAELADKNCSAAYKAIWVGTGF